MDNSHRSSDASATPQADSAITAYARWEFPALEAHVKNPSTWQVPKNEAVGLSFPTAQELEAIRHAAHQEGIEQGIALGQQQIREAVARLAQVAQQLYQPIEQQDQQLVQVMAELMQRVCKVVLQRELSVNTSQVVAIAQQALELLPQQPQQTVIFVHPQDLVLINSVKDQLGWRSEWLLKANAQLAPGGCVVECAKMRLDASVEQRFYEAIASFYIADKLPADPLQVASEFLVSDSSNESSI